MKHWIKIILAVIAFVVALVLAALVLVQIPPVQRSICNRVTEAVSEKTGMDLSVGDIHFALFDRFVLEDVSLMNGSDTLLACSRASAKISPLALLFGEFRVGRINLDGGSIYPANFPKSEDKDDDKPFALPDIKASVSHVILNNFRVVGYNPSGPFVNRSEEPGLIDFNDYVIEGLHLDIKDVKYDGKSASLSLGDLSFKEANSGTTLQNLSFDARWDTTGASISDFRFRDTHSDIDIPEASLAFRDFEAFSNFLESVPFKATIRDSKLDLTSLRHFVEKVPFLELKLIVDGSVEGTVADLRTESLKVWSGTKQSFLDIGAHLSGLPDAIHTMASIQVRRSYTNMADIAQIAYECSLDKQGFNKASIAKLAPGVQLSFEGSLNGFFEDFVVFGAVKSELGGCNVDLMCRTDETRAYEVLGFADLNDFDLGRFLQVKSLGRATCHASASGLFAYNQVDTEYYLDELSVPKLEFNGYTYSNISAAGNWKQNEFEGRIVSADPNLKFMLQGILAPGTEGGSLYHVKLSLGHADLAALNFDKRDLSTVRLNAVADITQKEDGLLMGKLTVKDIQCTSSTGTYNLNDVEVVTINGSERSMLGLSSGMLRARYRGSSPVTSIIPQLEGLVLLGKLDNVAHRMQKMPVPCTDKFDIQVKALDTRNLLAFLAPGIHIENGTTFNLNSKGDNTGNASLRSGLIAINNTFIQDLDAGFDFGETSTHAKVGTQMIRVGDAILADATLTADCEGNSLLADFDFCNDPDSLDAGCVKALLSFPNRKESKEIMLVHMGQSFLRLGGQQWNVDPASIYYREKHIAVNDFKIYNDDQGISVGGILSDNPADTCSFNIREMDLSLANLLMAQPLNISGTLSGSGKVTGIFSSPDIFGHIAADSLSIAGHLIGRLTAISRWDDEQHRVNIAARNILDGKEALSISGHYLPDKRTIDAKASAKGFGLGFIEPFISSLATDISGSLTADASITGTLDAPDIFMIGGHLEQFGAKLDYTKVPYILDGTIDMTPGKITLRNFSVKDMETGTGTLRGVVTHRHLKDFNIDININADNLIGFDTNIQENETFYGKAYATGNVGIAGPLSKLALNIDVATRPGTVVNIPIKSSSASSTSVITFIDSRPAARLSSIDSLINLHRAKEKQQAQSSGTGINVFARVRANDDARLNLEIDSATGDALHVNGNGTVDLTVKDNAFSITGDYIVSEGEYDLTLLGLFARNFNLDAGSTIHFTGDIMQSELDLKASYKTKASISPLIAAGTDSNIRRPVNGTILITGRLANPNLGFGIKIDDLDPTIEQIIETSFNTEEKRMRQLLALILSGSFIPDEQSGIVNNNSVSYFNATEIMSTQLNSILQQLGIPIDFGFNYQPTETGRDMFDVAVSTQLWSNRVSVNGNIGNRRFLTSNRDDIVGDVDVEVKLDRKGRTRLRLFSHSADEYSNYLDQTQRNGVGLSYKQEFNSFLDIFRKKKGKKQDVPATKAETPVMNEAETPLTKNQKD